jgi:hypothetical protein
MSRAEEEDAAAADKERDDTRLGGANPLTEAIKSTGSRTNLMVGYVN